MRPPWGKVWALALLLVLVVGGGWEILARQADLGPEYSDNRSLWANARHKLNDHGDNAITAWRIAHAIRRRRTNHE